MKRHGFFLVIFYLTVMASVLAPQAAHASVAIWADDIIIDKPLPSYNPGTKNASISLYGAKGEWIAFYVMALPSGESVSAWAPSVQSPLTSGGSTIANTNLTFYMVQTVTTTTSTYTGGIAGAWPDPCVPFVDRFYGETRNGTQQGWGKSVSSGTTQLFLVEIFIPATTPAGTYRGTLQLAGTGSSSGVLSQNIGVSLQVWNFTLPLSWTYGSAFGLAQNQTNGDLSATFGSYSTGVDLLTRSMVDHGLWPYGSAVGQGPDLNTTTGDAVFTGNFANSSYGYQSWLEGTKANNSNNPRPYYGFRPAAMDTRSSSGSVYSLLTTSAQFQHYFNDWGTYISGNLTLNYTDAFSGARRTTYFVSKTQDEAASPACCTTEQTYVNETAAGSSFTHLWPFETIGGALGCGPWAGSCSNTASESNHQLWTVSEMMGFCRIKGATGGNYPNTSFATRISTYGDKLWIYTADTQNQDYNAYGQNSAHVISSWFIDTVMGGRENAASALAMYAWGCSGFHYWLVNAGLQSGNWSNPAIGTAGYNGDGFIFYAGYGSSAKGYDIGGTHAIPIESLRMKLWRYGMNILEYANILQGMGQGSHASTQIANMYAPTPSSGTTWGTVSAWQTARHTMGQIISDQTALQPPTGLRLTE